MASDVHRMVEALMLAGHAIKGMANVLKENPGHLEPLPDGTTFTLADEVAVIARLYDMANASLKVAVHVYEAHMDKPQQESSELNNPAFDNVFEKLEVQ